MVFHVVDAWLQFTFGRISEETKEWYLFHANAPGETSSLLTKQSDRKLPEQQQHAHLVHVGHFSLKLHIIYQNTVELGGCFVHQQPHFLFGAGGAQCATVATMSCSWVSALTALPPIFLAKPRLKF